MSSDTEPTVSGREVWIEKYRPQRLGDIYGQSDAIERLRSYVDQDDLPHLLFSGPAGVGKTTSSVAIARELYGEEWESYFLELNASDQRGIDVVRDRIKNFARSSFAPEYGHTIVFLDEADSLCLPPGTEIVTGHPSDPTVKRIETIAADGEAIPSVGFDSNEIQPDAGRLVESGVADFFRVTLTDGRTVEASPTHPFFVVDETGRLVETELRELRPGDSVAEFSAELDVSRCGKTADRADRTVAADGGVSTAEIGRIEYSHRGPAYNVSMDTTPNFLLANGVLTHNTDDAQSALRRTMEQFSDNTRFILSCNYSSKIIDPIQSRCAVFRFSPLSDEAIASQIREIAATEQIELTDDGLDALVYAADGDMRRAINNLQGVATTDGPVTEADVYQITATARPEEIESMVADAIEGDFSRARATLDELLVETGIAGGDVIDQLHRSAWEFGLTERETVRLLERIGEADYRISEGANERVQLEALLASLSLSE